MKEWKTIKEIKFKNSIDLVEDLKKKSIKTSEWRISQSY